MFCDSYILTLNELELSLEIDDIPLETELDSLDDEIGPELSLETELSELDEFDDSLEAELDAVVAVVVAVKPPPTWLIENSRKCSFF